eukprot:391563_1
MSLETKEDNHVNNNVSVETSDGKKFRFFKSTLMKSTYFNSVLNGNWKESNQGTIFVQIRACDFELIHDLLIYGEVVFECMDDYVRKKFAMNCAYFGLKVPNQVAKYEKQKNYKLKLCHLCGKASQDLCRYSDAVFNASLCEMCKTKCDWQKKLQETEREKQKTLNMDFDLNKRKTHFYGCDCYRCSRTGTNTL